jgi:hypothetical protein
MHSSEKSMEKSIELILEEKNCKEPWRPLRDLAKEVERTRKSLKRKVLWFKWPGFILLVLVPVLSATISVMIGTSWKIFGFSSTGILSYFLTLFTILSSIFRPRDRFRKACNLEMDLDNLQQKFLINLERKRLGAIDSDLLLTQAEALNKSLQPIREAMIDLFLPDTAINSELKGAPKGGIEEEDGGAGS